MKTLLIFPIVVALFFSCGSDNSKKETTNSDNVDEPNSSNSDNKTDHANKAVLLWDGGIIDKPNSKEGKWVSSYQFGNTLTLTGETEENTEEKKNYTEVTGPDGKSGWINDYLIVKNAYVGVVINDVVLYKNPDVMSVSNDKVKKGEIVSVSAEDKSGFREVYGREKKVKGFVNLLENISDDQLDLKVAVLFKKALWKKTIEEKTKELQTILDDPANSSSKLLEVVKSKLEEINPPSIENLDAIIDSTSSN